MVKTRGVSFGFRSQEPGTQPGSGFPGTGNAVSFAGSPLPGTRNPPGFPVPGNSESILNFCEKVIIGYINIPLCLEMPKNEL